jgi:hypothetical protein
MSPTIQIIEKYQNPDKTLIIYCYYETKDTKANLEFFVKNALIDSTIYDFTIIINNSVCTVKFPTLSNLSVITRSDNETDLQTYAWYIKDLEAKTKNPFSQYKHFYFINSRCIGPFIPITVSFNWIDTLNKTMSGYELIGPIVEFLSDKKHIDVSPIKTSKNIPFIHTYMFGLGPLGFSIFKDILLELKEDTTKEFIVSNIEALITSKIILAGHKIKSFLLKYKNIDINNEKIWDKLISSGDPEIPEKYDGIDVNPLEVMFVKNIRLTNSTRPKEVSGLSLTLSKYIEQYKKWN